MPHPLRPNDVAQRVQDAARRLQGVAHRTPVHTVRTLDEEVGATVSLKCENFQRVGAFKFRGAFNAIQSLTSVERSRGVIAFSSGNHAQAVALVSRLQETQATIVMPRDAPATKLEATRSYGAQVVLYDADEQEREGVARELQRDGGQVLIPPYDHPDVIAGQGTTALELYEQAGPLDLLLVPCGGGGLLSGCAALVEEVNPTCRVVGVEPEQADDAARSFRTKELCRIDHPQTIADGTRTPSLGELTFPLILECVDDIVTVSEAAIAAAVRFLFYRAKLVIEPSGALGVAALLSGAVAAEGRVGVILSGGNVDGTTMAAILRKSLP